MNEEQRREIIADAENELLGRFDPVAVGHTDLPTWIACFFTKVEQYVLAKEAKEKAVFEAISCASANPLRWNEAGEPIPGHEGELEKANMAAHQAKQAYLLADLSLRSEVKRLAKHRRAL